MWKALLCLFVSVVSLSWPGFIEAGCDEYYSVTAVALEPGEPSCVNAIHSQCECQRSCDISIYCFGWTYDDSTSCCTHITKPLCAFDFTMGPPLPEVQMYAKEAPVQLHPDAVFTRYYNYVWDGTSWVSGTPLQAFLFTWENSVGVETMTASLHNGPWNTATSLIEEYNVDGFSEPPSCENLCLNLHQLIPEVPDFTCGSFYFHWSGGAAHVSSTCWLYATPSSVPIAMVPINTMFNTYSILGIVNEHHVQRLSSKEHCRHADTFDACA